MVGLMVWRLLALRSWVVGLRVVCWRCSGMVVSRGTTGGWLRSCPPAWGQPQASSLTSLRQPPAAPRLADMWACCWCESHSSALEQATGRTGIARATASAGASGWGVLQSEVKEEALATGQGRGT
jgi:hypothetical protein